MTFDSIGEQDIRGENISRAVKGFALKKFKIRQVCLVQSSSKWTETYYRESPTILTAGGNRSVGDVARGALPPEVQPSWEKLSSVQKKFMAQEVIYFEDQYLNAINVQARTLFRVGEAVASAVDNYIYDTLTADAGTSGTVAAADDWNSTTIANRDPIGDLLTGIAAIQTNNYDILDNGYLLIRAADYGNLVRNSKVINNPSFKTADVVSNGVVGQICGLKIIISQSVDTDECMIIMGQRACSYLQVRDLTTYALPDPGVNIKIRALAMGQLVITDPKAIYVVSNISVSPL